MAPLTREKGAITVANLYTTATPLHDVAGRIKYISGSHRKEILLASFDGGSELLGGRFWNQLAKECKAG